jgi:nitrogen PTS system EIIA component
VKIQDVLEKKGILIDLKAEDKASLLTQMGQYLASLYDLKDPEAIVHKLIEREAAMSTGIGYGIAIPHARLDGIGRIYMIAARCAQPLDYDAIDDNPVRLVFMMVSPTNTTSGHTQALSALSKIMSYEDMREKLAKARDAEAFLESITEGENRYVAP